MLNTDPDPQTGHNLDLVNSKFCIAVELWPLVRQLREVLKEEKSKVGNFQPKASPLELDHFWIIFMVRLEISNLFSTLMASLSLILLFLRRTLSNDPYQSNQNLTTRHI